MRYAVAQTLSPATVSFATSRGLPSLTRRRPVATMLVPPVTPELLTVPDPSAPEGSVFAASLFPYLAFLYFLSRPENRCPPRAAFGFSFLLVFVFASIPAAIAAQLCYNVTLSDCDWAHGMHAYAPAMRSYTEARLCVHDDMHMCA
eukprot:6175551-Pleurochrysis_carterae.AAC.1